MHKPDSVSPASRAGTDVSTTVQVPIGARHLLKSRRSGEPTRTLKENRNAGLVRCNAVVMQSSLLAALIVRKDLVEFLASQLL
jgi:hypothetical protein